MNVDTMILKWVPLQTRLGLILATLVIETLQTSGMTHPPIYRQWKMSKGKEVEIEGCSENTLRLVSPKNKFKGCECDSNWVNQIFKKFSHSRGTFLSVILCIDEKGNLDLEIVDENWEK